MRVFLILLLILAPLFSGCAIFDPCRAEPATNESPGDGPNDDYNARPAQIHRWINQYSEPVEITLATKQCGTLVASANMSAQPGSDAGWSAPGDDERLISAPCGTRERGNATEVQISIVSVGGKPLDDETKDGCGMASYFAITITSGGKLEIR